MKISIELIQRISKIKMLLTDVDGVMTDARIFLGDDGEWRRHYSVRDGAGVHFLVEAGYKTGIITGAASPDVKKRAEHLKFHYLYQKQTDKSPAFDEIKKLSGYTDQEICYIGDDLFDIPVLKQVGLAVTVPGGMDAVKKVSHYITQSKEGDGALRELCDLILQYGFYSQKGE
jgi:3-deoxy-D-manno-octulosonate 8-phosphate phosphatase (KDO 8-P phosphatase)